MPEFSRCFWEIQSKIWELGSDREIKALLIKLHFSRYLQKGNFQTAKQNKKGNIILIIHSILINLTTGISSKWYYVKKK